MSHCRFPLRQLGSGVGWVDQTSNTGGAGRGGCSACGSAAFCPSPPRTCTCRAARHATPRLAEDTKVPLVPIPSPPLPPRCYACSEHPAAMASTPLGPARRATPLRRGVRLIPAARRGSPRPGRPPAREGVARTPERAETGPKPPEGWRRRPNRGGSDTFGERSWRGGARERSVEEEAAAGRSAR